MPKKKANINPISCERIKTIVAESGMTQQAFAETVLHCSQQHLSRMFNQKAPVTSDTALQIKKHFSNIRVEWIMGEDNYKSNEDYFLALADAAEERELKMIDYENLAYYAFRCYLSRCGYTCYACESRLSSKDEDIMLDYFEQCDLYHDGLISKDPNKLDVDLQYYGQNMMRFLDNGKNEIGRCSKEAYEKTVKDVADYAEYKIRKLIEGSESNG